MVGSKNNLVKTPSYSLVFLDGILAENLSDVKKLSANITWHFNKGLHLEIKEDSILDYPLYLQFIATNNKTNNRVKLRNQIIVKANSQITIIEEYKALTESSYTNNIETSITSAAGSSITYYKLQHENEAATHKHNLIINQAAKSHVELKQLNSGGSNSCNKLLVNLTENGANFSLQGISFAHNTQETEYHLRIEHVAPNTTSNILYKKILNDKARASFSGRIVVANEATKAIAHLTNKNLLLSDTAEIKTEPELEVYADDVNCTHGATVGQLDNNALFYLQCRGIELKKAQELLIQGFIAEIIASFTLVQCSANFSRHGQSDEGWDGTFCKPESYSC